MNKKGNNTTNILNHSNVCYCDKLNPKVMGSLRPQEELGPDMKDWENVVRMNLNNINQVEKDDCKTSYVKYKLFKCDIYGLALVKDNI